VHRSRTEGHESMSTSKKLAADGCEPLSTVFCMHTSLFDLSRVAATWSGACSHGSEFLPGVFECLQCTGPAQECTSR
jgi:hypothetical protein